MSIMNLTQHIGRVLILLCAVFMLSGCGDTASDSSSNTPDTLLELQQKADRFAQSELARYNAAELIYKNIPELHTTRVPINNQLIQGWTKTYRRFTDYEVVDIVHSESILAPIQYEINFHYEQYNTPYRKTDQPTAQEQCENDFRYELRFTDSLIRHFDCDEKGDLLEGVSEIPERPLYFKKDYLRETSKRPSLP